MLNLNRRITDQHQTPRHDENSLDYCAQEYLRLRISDYGIDFETFAKFPQLIIDAIEGADVRPLLLKQQQVMLRVLRDEQLQSEVDEHEQSLQPDGVYNANGRLIEPMHHTAHPRKKPRRFFSHD